MAQIGAQYVQAVDPVPVGSLQAYAGADAPTGWLICNGSTHSVSTYPELYSVLGETYGPLSPGPGGGEDTLFRIPDLRGRMPIGAGNEGAAANSTNRVRGVKGGDTRMPQHGHQVRVNSFAGDRQIACGPLGADGDKYSFSDSGNDASTTTANLYAANAGTGTGDNMPPFLVTNYIIKATSSIPRGGTALGSTPPIVTALPVNPQFGEEVYLYNPTTAGYRLAKFSGTSWALLPESTTITIDSSGRMTLPYQPSFKAYASGGQINNPAFGSALIFGDTSYGGGHNVGGHYNTGNGRFTAPIAGRYWFSFAMLTNPGFSTNDPGHATIYLSINGNRTHYMAHNHNQNWTMEGSAIVFNLAQNDYVYALLDYGSGHYGTYSYFCGGLLG